MSTKLFYYCPQGHKHYLRMSDWLNGIRCRFCKTKQSKGANKVETYLMNLNFTYTKEYKFSDCRLTKALPFDFAINIQDKLFLIEFNGKQHYQSIKMRGGDEGLEIQKKRDQIKVNYCQKNNIPLLIIPYHEEKNISLIIKNFLPV